MKNKFILSFLKLFVSKKKKIFLQHPQILIVSTTGMGDSLWATPAIKALKTNFPKTSVSLLCSPIAKEIFQFCPFIDKFYLLKNHSFFSFLKLFFQIHKKKFGAILIFHSSQRLTLPLCSFLSPQFLVGIEGRNKGLDKLLTHKVKDFGHEINKRLQIIKILGIQTTNTQLIFWKNLNEKFKLNLQKKPFVVFHPGAKDIYKCWSKDNFIKLGKQFKCNIILIGTKNEKNLLQNIKSNLKNCDIFYDLSLQQLALLLEQSLCLITNDSGPLHFAAALKIKTIGLYCPTDPNICGPLGISSTLILYQKPTCSPCLKRNCKTPYCLDKITVDSVIKKIFCLNLKHVINPYLGV